MKDQDSQEQGNSFGQRFANLFHRTWEMELLLFGFVLVFLWKVPDKLYIYSQKLSLLYGNDATGFSIVETINGLMVALIGGVHIMIIGMLLHLLLRGFWIATIGLHSTFPEGANLSKLKLNERFQRFFSKNLIGLDRFEKNLDDICSANFALVFLIFFAWWGFVVPLIIFVFILSKISQQLEFLPMPIGILILLFFVLILLFLILYMFDFFSNGKVKSIQKKWIAIPYFYWYRFMSFITLSFLFRPIYYTFITNKTRKIIPFLAAFFLLIFMGVGNSEFKTKVFFPDRKRTGNGYLGMMNYENELPENALIKWPVIPRKRIEKDQMSLFLPYRNFYSRILNTSCPKADSLSGSGFFFLSGATQKEGPLASGTIEDRERILQCLEKLDTLSIDSQRVEGLEFKFYHHPRNKIPGFLTYVPLVGLKPGWHELSIQEGGVRETRIPFYYDPPPGAKARRPGRIGGKEPRDTGTTQTGKDSLVPKENPGP
ncbi:MAG: hypothetical protein ABEH38_06195 [Flavobacteriales bacterium]